MDWYKEADALRVGGENIWKPKAGMHSVEFLDDGTPNEFNWEGEVIKKVRFKVKVNGAPETKEWNIGKGETKSSLYGQLAMLGKDKGTLVGSTIELLVTGSGKDSKYTVPDAVRLMNAEEKDKEELVQ